MSKAPMHGKANTGKVSKSIKDPTGHGIKKSEKGTHVVGKGKKSAGKRKTVKVGKFMPY